MQGTSSVLCNQQSLSMTSKVSSRKIVVKVLHSHPVVCFLNSHFLFNVIPTCSLWLLPLCLVSLDPQPPHVAKCPSVCAATKDDHAASLYKQAPSIQTSFLATGPRSILGCLSAMHSWQD